MSMYAASTKADTRGPTLRIRQRTHLPRDAALAAAAARSPTQRTRLLTRSRPGVGPPSLRLVASTGSSSSAVMRHRPGQYIQTCASPHANCARAPPPARAIPVRHIEVAPTQPHTPPLGRVLLYAEAVSRTLSRSVRSRQTSISSTHVEAARRTLSRSARSRPFSSTHRPSPASMSR